ncbi:MAG: hypothetical protein IJW23_09655, partial [Lentisphaeria bacterium]|nr:hypothetical protein [Lentisphaeria bacterium]
LNLSRRSLKGEDGTPPLSSPPEPCAEEDSQTFLRHSDFYDVKIEMPSKSKNSRRIYQPVWGTALFL